MTITLPDGIAERIEALAKQKGFPSVAEFLIDLVEESDEDDSAPPELSPKNRAELDAMLEAGMNSGQPVRRDAGILGRTTKKHSKSEWRNGRMIRREYRLHTARGLRHRHRGGVSGSQAYRKRNAISTTICNAFSPVSNDYQIPVVHPIRPVDSIPNFAWPD